MSSYEGRHAELYDLFYADKDYVREASFVHDCLTHHATGGSGRLLELACGSGRHAVELARLGHDVVAIDHSASMLAAARRNVAAAAVRVELYQQDLRSLALPHDPFDAATCFFDSLGYVATNEGLASALGAIHRHLRPGGLFVCELWHAAAMLRRFEPVRVRRWSRPEGELLRISETVLDVARQTARVTYTVHEHRRDGSCWSFQEEQENRYFLVPDMAFWLAGHGFVPLQWFAGYTPDERITEDTWHVVVVARRDERVVGAR